MMSTSLLLKKKEAAALLHVSEWKVEQLISKGLLPVVPVGSRDLIRPEDVQAYVTQNVHRKDQAAPGSDEVIVISAY